MANSGLKESVFSNGFKSNICIIPLQKYGFDRDKTGLIDLVYLSRSNIEYFTTMQRSLDKFVNILADQYADSYFCGKSTKISEFRNKVFSVVERLRKETDLGSIITVDNWENAFDLCNKFLQMEFKNIPPRPFNSIDYVQINPSCVNQFVPGFDEYCIIHDRDFSDRYSSKSTYERAQELAVEDSGKKIRWIITMPFVELWLYMHNPKFNPGILEKINTLLEKGNTKSKWKQVKNIVEYEFNLTLTV